MFDRYPQTIGIDPGLVTGLAAIHQGELHRVRVVDSLSYFKEQLRTLHSWGHARILIEKPQVYVTPYSKGDPNDLITLAIQVGRYVEICSLCTRCDITLVFPKEWKGQVPKEMHNARILKALSQKETQVLNEHTAKIAKGKMHNVYDAIGLAKYHHARVA